MIERGLSRRDFLKTGGVGIAGAALFGVAGCGGGQEGEGDMDIGRLVELLEGAGYSRWYVLEQDIVVENEPEEGEGPVTDVLKSLAYLQRQLEKIA